MRINKAIKAIIFSAIVISISALSTPAPTYAQSEDVFNNSGLPIPRFVSLRSDKVFVRTGPALRYPIKWVFVKKDLPAEIIQEFDTWRKIRDLDGEEGWIHQSLLSGRRTALVKAADGDFLFRKPVSNARPVAMLEPRVIVTLKQCAATWCAAESMGFKGWIERKSLWGVYPDEELD